MTDILTTPIVAKPVAQLHKVRRILAAGWCQGEEEDDKGNHCIEGAIRMAAQWSAEDRVALRMAFINGNGWVQDDAAYGKVWLTPAMFNDASERTLADVLAATDNAITFAEIQAL